MIRSCMTPKFLFRRNMTSYSTVLIEKFGQVTAIGINRPEKRNCIDLQTAIQLQNAIDKFENDTDSFAAVLYGTGGNFCSGIDLNELVDNQSNSSFNENILMRPSLQHVKKPLVAALSGYAVAGGLELALLCDLRVMEDTAVLGLYGRRFGVPLVDGATVRLQAMIGLSRALDMILTGRSVNAKEAFEWGLANRIVACGTGLGQAIQLATSLVKFPQECLLVDRNSTYNAAFNDVYEELLKYERDNAKKIKFSDIIQGAKKFISGTGKHGKVHNLTEKVICDWEKEFSNPKSKL